MTTTTYYAAIENENGTGTVYGVGLSPEAAIEDAREWCPGESIDDLIAVECSPAAYAYVVERGGQTSSMLSVSLAGVCLSPEEE